MGGFFSGIDQNANGQQVQQAAPQPQGQQSFPPVSEFVSDVQGMNPIFRGILSGLTGGLTEKRVREAQAQQAAQQQQQDRFNSEAQFFSMAGERSKDPTLQALFGSAAEAIRGGVPSQNFSFFSDRALNPLSTIDPNTGLPVFTPQPSAVLQGSINADDFLRQQALESNIQQQQFQQQQAEQQFQAEQQQKQAQMQSLQQLIGSQAEGQEGGVISNELVPFLQQTGGDLKAAQELFDKTVVAPRERKERLIKEALGREDKLRTELVQQSKDFVAKKNAFTSILNAAKDGSGVSDTPLVISFIKTFEPTGIVTESDYNNVADRISVSDRIRNGIKTALRGGKLTPELRKDIVRIARANMQSAAQQQKKLENSYRTLATSQKLNPKHVVSNSLIEGFDIEGNGKKTPVQNLKPADLSKLSVEELQALRQQTARPQNMTRFDPNTLRG